jgi:hypothetical protein
MENLFLLEDIANFTENTMRANAISIVIAAAAAGSLSLSIFSGTLP